MLAALTMAMAPAWGEEAVGLGAVLLRRWCAAGENRVFSPYSIESVMAMLGQGAKGSSADEIAKALGAADAAETAVGFKLRRESLEAARDRTPDVELVIANAIYPQAGMAVAPEFADSVATNFHGRLHSLDYRNATEEARTHINTWVAETTKERIKDLLAPGTLTPDSRLTLVNAIYFKGKWAHPFDPAHTAMRVFHSGEENEREVPTMQRTGKMRYGEFDGVQAVELPYAGGELSMLVLLPPENGGLSAVGELLTRGFPTAWKLKSRLREVRLWLPRFTIEWERECGEALRQAGIAEVFDAARADLSGIAGQKGDLVVSAVIHKAFVEVAEEGTEAAAATAVMVRMTAMLPEEPVLFRADRPFVFLIRHEASDTTLFAGVLTKVER